MVESNETLRSLLDIPNISVSFNEPTNEVTVLTPEKELPTVVANLSNVFGNDEALRVIKLEKHTLPGFGSGRRVRLETEISLKEAVERTKKHCGIPHVRLAIAKGKDLGKI